MGVLIISWFKEPRMELLPGLTCLPFLAARKQRGYLSVLPTLGISIQAEGGRGGSSVSPLLSLTLFPLQSPSAISHSFPRLFPYLFLLFSSPPSLFLTHHPQRGLGVFSHLCGMNSFLAVFFLPQKHTLICFDCDTM